MRDENPEPDATQARDGTVVLNFPSVEYLSTALEV